MAGNADVFGNDVAMKNNGNNSEIIILRKKAEKLLKRKSFKKGSKLSEAEMLKLIQNLEDHQKVLELQNQELRLAKEQAAEAATDKYTELYNFAPSGYFTLSKEGEILELNLCGSQMLGRERSFLKKSRFVSFISSDTKPVFDLFFEQSI